MKLIESIKNILNPNNEEEIKEQINDAPAIEYERSKNIK